MDKFEEIDKQKHWDKKLDRTKVFFDPEILKRILELLDFTYDDLIALSGNQSFTRPKQIHKYEKVREIADVLGIPAWMLLTDYQEKDVIILSDDETLENLISYKLSSLADLLNTFENDIKYLVLIKSDRDSLETNLNETWKIINEKEDWSIMWDKIYKHIKTGISKDRFDWAGNILFLRGHEIAHIATLKVFKHKIINSNKARVEKNKRKVLSVQNAWLLIKRFGETEKNPKLLEKILINISNCFGNSYRPDIKLESKDEYTKLFSWHSHFDKDKQELGQLNKQFDTKIKRLDSISEKVLFQMNNYFYGQYPDLHKIEDEYQLVTNVLTDEIKEEHKLNTLEFLVKRRHLKDGSRIVFKHCKKEEHLLVFPKESPFWSATIVEKGRKKLVKWEYDQQTYHLTPLTNKMLGMLNINEEIKHGAKLWVIDGGSQNLYNFALSIKEGEIKYDGHISLF